MVHIVKSDRRDLKRFDAPGVTVQVSDPIVGKDDCLSAGFTEYLKPGRLEWTFDYNEVFFILEGALEVQPSGQDPVKFETGDLGYIEKGAQTVITIPQRALLLHVTQPAWRD